jgi:hypothetical protein
MGVSPYHIENYLLDAGSIREATATLLTGMDEFSSDDKVILELRSCAEDLVDGLVLERLQAEVNGLLVGAISIGGPRDTSAPAQDLLPSVEGSLQRLSNLGQQFTLDDLADRAERHRATLESALADGSWLREFPGRSIIGRFVQRRLQGRIDPLLFSNAVLDKMVEHAVKDGC